MTLRRRAERAIQAFRQTDEPPDEPEPITRERVVAGSEQEHERRVEAAMSLHDPGLMAYLLFTIRENQGGDDAAFEVILGAQVPDGMWPALVRSMYDLIEEIDQRGLA